MTSEYLSKRDPKWILLYLIAKGFSVCIPLIGYPTAFDGFYSFYVRNRLENGCICPQLLDSLAC
jgi:hypothetical protein